MKLVLSFALALAVAGTRDAESDAWNAALAIKKKADYAAAALAFEHFHESFPTSAHAIEARVESGVCWFSDGRAKQILHRTTPEARESFGKALSTFELFTAEKPELPASSRAQYMKGSTHLFMGDLESAEAEYGAVLDTFKLDPAYVGKALERRAYTRRHLLRTKDALADMQRWVKEFGSPNETLAAVKQQIELSAKLERPAPELGVEAWVQGEPQTLESLAGQVVGLYFFATWCPNCEKELPFMLDLDARFAARGLRLIGVVDHSKGQTLDSVRAFAAKEHIPWPVFMSDGRAAVSYGASNIPFLALIDGEGKLRWCDTPAGLCDWTLEALLGSGADK